MSFVKKITKFSLFTLLFIFLASGVTTSFILPVDTLDICAPHEAPVEKFKDCFHCGIYVCESVLAQ